MKMKIDKGDKVYWNVAGHRFVGQVVDVYVREPRQEAERFSFVSTAAEQVFLVQLEDGKKVLKPEHTVRRF